MTQNEAINQVLELARSEIGYHEKASDNKLDDKTANSGSGNWTKYAAYLDSYAGFYNGPKNGFAWCDVFVDYLFVKSFGLDVGREMLCQPMNSAGAGCLYSAQYYKQTGRWYTSPQPGDQIFFTYSAGEVSHTGIVESVNGSSVTTIEGNTSDRVARHTYSTSNGSIYGYGRPRWELASSLKATANPVITTTTASSATVVKKNEILRKGSYGEKVEQLQKDLQKLGYSLGKYGVDGDYGNDTYNAVKKFQKDHGLTQDGEVGPSTLEAIRRELGAASVTNSFFEVGDIVAFVGTKQYSTYSATLGYSSNPGRAIVIGVSKAAKHPYRLCKINGYGSNVYGWVDYSDVKKVS